MHGVPHIYHIGCGLAFLSWYQYGPRAAEYEKFDDRLFKSREGLMGKGSGIRQNRDDRAFKASPAVPESPVFRRKEHGWRSECCGAGPLGEVDDSAATGDLEAARPVVGFCSECKDHCVFEWARI